jgi:hypothetical protein
MRLGLHTLAYAIMVLFRAAVAAEVPELATAEVGTIRQRMLKVGARVTTSARRIWFHFSASWPTRDLFLRACHALDRYVVSLMPVRRTGPLVAAALLK